MPLPMEMNEPFARPNVLRWLVFGQPKIGKSWFARTFPEPYFFECTPGLDHLRVRRVKINTWEKFLERCAEFSDSKGIGTLVIDTVDDAYNMCYDYICAKLGVESPKELGRWQAADGWGQIKKEFRRVIMRLEGDCDGKSCGLVFISQEKSDEITIRDASGETKKISTQVPSLTGSPAGVISPTCALIGRIVLDPDSYDPMTKSFNDRIFELRSDPLVMAGSHIDGLPPFFKARYDAFVSALGGSKAAMKPKPLKGRKGA